MIKKEDLVEGEWYDGFVWGSDHQKGVATLYWNTHDSYPDGYDGYFFGPGVNQYGYHHPDANYSKVQTFEPNVRSKKP